MISTSRLSAAACLVGAAAMLFSTLTACAPVDSGARTSEIAIEVTTPSGDVHETFGSRAELLAPMTDKLPSLVVVDGESTDDPARIVGADRVDFVLPGGTAAHLDREGEEYVLYTSRADADARFRIDRDDATLTIALEAGDFVVHTEGVAADDVDRYLGGTLYRYLTGTGTEHIAGLEEAHAFWIVIIIIIEVAILLEQVERFASMLECRANWPTKCAADAQRVCSEQGFKWSVASWSCTCGFLCSIGLGDVEASCKISCGNTEEEARANAEQVAVD